MNPRREHLVKGLFSASVIWQPIDVVAWLVNIHIGDLVAGILAIMSIMGLVLLVVSFFFLCTVDTLNEQLMERGLCDACKQIYRNYKDGEKL